MAFIGQLEPEGLVASFIDHPPAECNATRLASGVPAFTLPFDLLTTAEPALRRRVDGWPLQRAWRHWLRPRTRFIGSTVTEYAWLPADADPAALARQLRDEEGRRCPLLVVKDLPDASPLLDDAQNAWAARFAAACADAGFTLMQGQALAWVPIDFDTVEDYLAALSRGRRRDMKRKLRARERLVVERVPTGPAFADDARVDEAYALYLAVYAQSEIHFDKLSRAFFAAVLRDAGAGGIVFEYRHADRLIGWNLCYAHGGVLVDKYMGLRYPDAREHNLYAVSWMENLAYARERGLRAYVAGWTDPEVKAHLGARFTFTRHAVYLRNPLLRRALARFAPRFEGDRAWWEATST